MALPVHPAAQTQAPPLPPATAPLAPPAAATPPSAEIRVGADGYVHGIDGMLDQIASALMRQARTEILPTLQRDRTLQATIGAAAGRELARPLWALAGIAAAYVGWQFWRAASAGNARVPGRGATPRASRTRP